MNQELSTDTDRTVAPPDHRLWLGERLWHLQQAGELCDFVLLCGHERLPVHRLILRACTPKLVNHSSMAHHQEELVINNYDTKDIMDVVKYMYTGQLTLTKETVDNITKLAEEWEYTEVMFKCFRFKEILKTKHDTQEIGAELGLPILDPSFQRSSVSEQQNKETLLEEEIKDENLKTNVILAGENIEGTEDAVDSYFETTDQVTLGQLSSPQNPSLPVCKQCPLREQSQTTRSLTRIQRNTEMCAGLNLTNIKNTKHSINLTKSSSPKTLGKNDEKRNSSQTLVKLKIAKKTGRRKKLDPKQSQCPVCQKKFATPKYCQRHLKWCQGCQAPNKKRCLQCNVYFDSGEEFRRHKKESHSEMARKGHTCQVCGKRFGYKETFIMHRWTMHWAPGMEEPKVFKCSDAGCEYSTIHRGYMERHKTIHVEGFPFVCEICGRKFKGEYFMKMHVKRHTVPRLKFPCDQCGRQLSTSKDLELHRERIHEKREYVCAHCTYFAHTQRAVNVHMFKHHDVPLPKSRYKPQMKIFQCQLCGFKDTAESNYKKHLLTHSDVRNFACSVCDGRFKNDHALKQHEKKIHSTGKKLGCPYEGCPYTCSAYYGQNRLELHIRNMHTNKDARPWQCSVCEYRTKLKGNLKKHFEKRHGLPLDPDLKAAPYSTHVHNNPLPNIPLPEPLEASQFHPKRALVALTQPQETPTGGALTQPQETPTGGALTQPQETPTGGALTQPQETPTGGALTQPQETPTGGLQEWRAPLDPRPISAAVDITALDGARHKPSTGHALSLAYSSLMSLEPIDNLDYPEYDRTWVDEGGGQP